MALVKHTLFFEAGKHGWSESYYLTAVSAAGSEATLNQLAEIRRQCLVPAVAITGIRASVDGYPPDSLLAEVNLPGQLRNNAGVAFVAAPYYAAALVRLDTPPIAPTGQVLRRNLLLRGIPRDILTATGAWAENQSFQDFRFAVLRFIERDALPLGYSLRRKVYGTSRTVNSVSNYGTRQLRIITTLPLGVAPRTRIQVFFATGTRGVNGIHVIDSINDVEIVTRPLKRAPLITAGATFGVVYPITFETIQWNRVTIPRSTRKATGRPFSLSRGRAAVRAD